MNIKPITRPVERSDRDPSLNIPKGVDQLASLVSRRGKVPFYPNEVCRPAPTEELEPEPTGWLAKWLRARLR
jgi:hypothetical protein